MNNEVSKLIHSCRCFGVDETLQRSEFVEASVHDVMIVSEVDARARARMSRSEG